VLERCNVCEWRQLKSEGKASPTQLFLKSDEFMSSVIFSAYKHLTPWVFLVADNVWLLAHVG
jgi:hypothetical protein